MRFANMTAGSVVCLPARWTATLICKPSVAAPTVLLVQPFMSVSPAQRVTSGRQLHDSMVNYALVKQKATIKPCPSIVVEFVGWARTAISPKAKQGLACVGQILLAHRGGGGSFDDSGLAKWLDCQLECSTVAFHPLACVVQVSASQGGKVGVLSLCVLFCEKQSGVSGDHLQSLWCHSVCCTLCRADT